MYSYFYLLSKFKLVITHMFTLCLHSNPEYFIDCTCTLVTLYEYISTLYSQHNIRTNRKVEFWS